MVAASSRPRAKAPTKPDISRRPTRSRGGTASGRWSAEKLRASHARARARQAGGIYRLPGRSRSGRQVPRATETNTLKKARPAILTARWYRAKPTPRQGRLGTPVLTPPRLNGPSIARGPGVDSGAACPVHAQAEAPTRQGDCAETSTREAGCSASVSPVSALLPCCFGAAHRAQPSATRSGPGTGGVAPIR